jgi:hypothetical protein
MRMLPMPPAELRMPLRFEEWRWLNYHWRLFLLMHYDKCTYKLILWSAMQSSPLRFYPIIAQVLAKNHAFPVEFWHVLVKQTYQVLAFNGKDLRMILSGYRRRLRLQYRQ